MRVLVIGGAKHGEWLDLFDGIRMWVNLMDANSYVIRTLHSNVTDMADGSVLEAYTLRVAVHPDLVGPNEPATVQGALMSMAMNEFSRAHGDREEIPKEPSPEIVTPDR